LAHAGLGDTYLAKGMYTEAGRSYQRYLTLCPGQSRKADAHFLLGRLNYLKGDYGGAVQECRQASELDPTMPEAHWILGLSLIKLGMFKQAEAETLAVSQLTETDGADESRAYYHHLMGEFCLSQGLQKRALHSLRKAANVASLGRTFFLTALGQAYLNIGDYATALGEFEAALDANPNCPQTHYLLGLLYDRQGAKEKAAEHFGRLVEVCGDADENLPQLIDAKKRLELL
jgi:tetratricopeptide (TPR) repeat protein